jgi:hypothetical protein
MEAEQLLAIQVMLIEDLLEMQEELSQLELLARWLLDSRPQLDHGHK